MKVPHIPVLLQEVSDAFEEIKNGTIVDCTVGYGGHSERLLTEKPDINMICIDQDDEALDFSKNRLEQFSNRVTFVKGRFSSVVNSLPDMQNIRGLLADIGVSSLQLDHNNRGFNFTGDNLDMRMDQTNSFSAYEVVNSYSEKDLEKIFREYADVRDSKRVASLIVKERENGDFKSSKQLAEFLEKNLYRNKIHPATLIFQAIRIEVNDELGELKKLLNFIRESNINKCLIAIISFHSLEDRIVKEAFKEWSKSCVCPKESMRCVCGNNHSFGKIVTKKPIITTKKEINENPRSRSSKLRLFKVQR